MKLFNKRISRTLVGLTSFLLLSGLSFSQDDCGSAITVADLTGVVCATSAHQILPMLSQLELAKKEITILGFNLQRRDQVRILLLVILKMDGDLNF